MVSSKVVLWDLQTCQPLQGKERDISNILLDIELLSGTIPLLEHFRGTLLSTYVRKSGTVGKYGYSIQTILYK